MSYTDRIGYRSVNLPRGGKFCPGSAPNGAVSQPTEGSKTQKRHEHRKRMENAGTWDPKTTPAEDPKNPGQRLPKV